MPMDSRPLAIPLTHNHEYSSTADPLQNLDLSTPPATGPVLDGRFCRPEFTAPPTQKIKCMLNVSTSDDTG